jgi:hypothetical protein
MNLKTSCWEQNTRHTLANYRYCVGNPNNFVTCSNF